jgi:hypothetical protein
MFQQERMEEKQKTRGVSSMPLLLSSLTISLRAKAGKTIDALK